jgi:hypothetical protein
VQPSPSNNSKSSKLLNKILEKNEKRSDSFERFVYNEKELSKLQCHQTPRGHSFKKIGSMVKKTVRKYSNPTRQMIYLARKLLAVINCEIQIPARNNIDLLVKY